MTEQVSRWFSVATQASDKNQQVVEIIRKCFQEDDQTLEDTADNLTNLVCSKIIQGKDVWAVLFELAKDIPDTHEGIVDLLKEMLIWPDGTEPVRPLVEMKSAFHDEWHDMHHGSTHPLPCNRVSRPLTNETAENPELKSKVADIDSIHDPSVQPWINFNIFTSLCIPVGIIDAAWGLEHVVEALETNIASSNRPPYIRVFLIAAEKILINCAEYFLQYPPQNQDDDGAGIYNTSWGWESEKCPPDEGLTEDRWNYWCIKLMESRQYKYMPLELSGGSTYASIVMALAAESKSW